MKTRVILIVVALMIALSGNMKAQIGNVLRNKASQAIGNLGKKAEKKAEEKADSVAVQKIEQEIDQKAAESGQNRDQKGFNFGGLLGGKVTLKYENEYNFHNYLYMLIEIFDENDVVKMDYYIYFNPDSKSGCVETRMVAETDDGSAPLNTAFISDDKNKCILMLTDMGSLKMGFISEVPEEEEIQETGTVDQDKIQITRTGNTRVITGYRCDEYIYREEGEKVYGKFWFTRDLKLNTDRRTMNNSSLPKYYSRLPEDGTVLAMETYDENNKLTMRSETKEIKNNINHTVSTSGYSLRQLNYEQMQEQSQKKR